MHRREVSRLGSGNQDDQINPESCVKYDQSNEKTLLKLYPVQMTESGRFKEFRKVV